MSPAAMPERQPAVLLVGYGNELRGDDAVAARVARAVASWELPAVRALALHQLTPELAAQLAEADAAIFVDAWQDAGATEPRLERIEPAPEAALDAHIGDPRSLLGLTEALYGRSPRAWLLLIPAAEFALGAGLSALSCRGMISALRFLRDMLPRLPDEGEGGRRRP